MMAVSRHISVVPWPRGTRPINIFDLISADLALFHGEELKQNFQIHNPCHVEIMSTL